MTETIYTLYPVFRVAPGVVDLEDAEAAVKEAADLFAEWEDRVKIRGFYSTVGFRADADIMMWWVARSPDDLQSLLVEFRRTLLGVATELTWSFMGAVRPPETAPDHVPAFVRDTTPGKYLNVYPFVRSAEWYLLPSEERGQLLRDHGILGREYPGVQANTTSGFGLGDWEWILAFEADDLTDIVDCIRRLRDSSARLYTKEEVPFVTGIRKPLEEVVADVL
jgi:chlorite dismutase